MPIRRRLSAFVATCVLTLAVRAQASPKAVVGEGNAVVTGVDKLKDAVVEAPDIRAGGALMLAALAAEGTSQIGGLEFIDRGYEFAEQKLTALGASAMRVSGVAPVLPAADVTVTETLPRVVTPYAP